MEPEDHPALSWFAGIAVLAVVIAIIMVVMFFALRIWEFVAVWRPGDGTYLVDERLGASNVRLQKLVVADSAMTVFLAVDVKNPSQESHFHCPISSATSAEDGLGQTIEIVAHHIEDVYSDDYFRPNDYECRGHEGERFFFPAGQPELFWAKFKLHNEFGLKVSVGLDRPRHVSWSPEFKIGDLKKT